MSEHVLAGTGCDNPLQGNLGISYFRIKFAANNPLMDDSRRYPIGQQNFKILRESGSYYVDKTMYVEKIARNSSRYYFLGRPRRFGKSLFLSTLQYFFEGERHLFKGLFIDTVEWDWKPYAVLRLDLNVEKYGEPGVLDGVLDNYFSKWEHEYGVRVKAQSLSVRFQNIIEAAHRKTGRKAVILVDEYDKPLVGNLNRDDNFEHYREKLAAVYSNFKSSAEHIELVFLTGVSRFNKLSVFSDLNNLNDITFDDGFADICGITELELSQTFTHGLNALAQKYGITCEEASRLLKANYDGYRFAAEGSDIYNPWSLLNCLSKKQILNYWSLTGHPTIIAEALKRMDADLEKTLNARLRFRSLAALDLKGPDPTALLFQAGYLTIKNYDWQTDTVQLGVPNKEVKESLFEELLPFYLQVKRGAPMKTVLDLIDDIRDGRPERMVKDLDIFLSAIPYDMKIDNENNFHNAIYILLTLIGFEIETEVRTSDGRIDLVLKTPKFIYIIELKFDKSAREAIDQIERKQYALLYAGDPRRIFKIGLNFSKTTRRLDPPEIV